MEVTDRNAERTCFCSDKMTLRTEGGDDNMKLIECLRGRLLAQRQTSQVAKEEAEFTGNRLVMLEKQLREETRLRDRAEKKLTILRKKLEGFESLASRSHASCSSSITTSSETNEETALAMHNHCLDATKDDCNPRSKDKFGKTDAELPRIDSRSSSTTEEVATFHMVPDQTKDQNRLAKLSVESRCISC